MMTEKEINAELIIYEIHSGCDYQRSLQWCILGKASRIWVRRDERARQVIVSMSGMVME